MAGAHHDYASNREHPRAAALASLAQRLYIQLSIDGDGELWKCARAPELDFLALDEDARRALLEAVRRAWQAHAPAGAAR